VAHAWDPVEREQAQIRYVRQQIERDHHAAPQKAIVDIPLRILHFSGVKVMLSRQRMKTTSRPGRHNIAMKQSQIRSLTAIV